MRLIPLGTNGFFPSFDRHTACYVIPFGGTLIVLDAGSGLFRFAEPAGKKLLENIDQVHIFLSHYHLDHTFGFYAAFKLLEGKKVTVFGNHKRQVFWEFVTLKYFPVDYSKKHKNFKWINLEEGEHEISSYKVAVKKQNHRDEVSLAYRFSFGLSYVTDGEPTKSIVDFVKRSPVLLCEHSESGEEILNKKNISWKDYILDDHITTTGAATIAKEAKVGKLVLIHHKPFDDDKALEKKLTLARKVFPQTYLAQDLEKIEID